MNPRARRAELVVREVVDETLVYDLRRHRAHCLNRTAALVWRACDGRTPVAAIGRMLEQETGAEGGAEAAVLALSQLRRAGLLDEASLESVPAGISRRRALGRMAATALLVPTVISVTAPTAGAVSSGGGQACKKNSDCGPGGSCLFGRCV